MKLIDEVEVANTLGEGVIWDDVSQRILWTDIAGRTLYQYDPIMRSLEQWTTPERLCCFAPVAIEGKRIPLLITAFESGFAYYQAKTGKLEWIQRIETDNPSTRLNDGRTDRFGNFWAGGMVEDSKHKGDKAHLYCLDRSLKIHCLLDDISISNSLCWSPNSDRLYHCDTPKRTINQYNFDPTGPSICNQTSFTQTDSGCFPDGSIVDADGFLWNAQWAGSKVVRYTPDGDIDLELAVPVSQPTCVAFGGKNLDLLIVTSAHQDLNSTQRTADPKAGNLLIYQTKYKGLSEQPFQPKNRAHIDHFKF